MTQLGCLHARVCLLSDLVRADARVVRVGRSSLLIEVEVYVQDVQV